MSIIATIVGSIVAGWTPGAFVGLGVSRIFHDGGSRAASDRSLSEGGCG
jgi:hypothetical protein